ncbi:MAG: hypothetical protein MUP11_13265 [Anaerolineales bacterium]|nr:hypothetical protein [Anaerolineales bacterium]
MAFHLITAEHRELIQKLVDKIPTTELGVIVKELSQLIYQVKNDIPEKRRISTGRYSIVKALGVEIYPLLAESGIEVLDFASALFNYKKGDPFVRSLAVQLVSLYGLHTSDLEFIKPFFKRAAADRDWIVRECASGLVRKLTKKYPQEMREWYLVMVRSADPNQRRFVSESLRPVVENRWFHKDSEYSLGVIRHLFKEPAPYPRTSVGNNLSDWMRVNREITWPIVSELALNGNRNSYWIATRACRNLVKKDPIRVMDLLGVDEYRYKTRHFRREDYKD